MQFFLQHDKVWQIRFWLAFALGGLGFACTAAGAEINGAAVYEQYGKEQFLAILKLPLPTDDAQTALDQANSAVMEYVITTNTLSKRSLTRHWLEAVVVNADRSSVDAQSNGLTQLMDLLKGPLVHGDHLAIAGTAGGLQVSLNELAIGTIAAPGLLPVLLQTWIGPVPPSSAFRNAILASGKPVTGLMQRYQSTLPTAERRIQVEQVWLAQPTPDGEAATGDNQAIAEADLTSPTEAIDATTAAATAPTAAPSPTATPSLGLSSSLAAQISETITPETTIAPQAPTLPLTAALDLTTIDATDTLAQADQTEPDNTIEPSSSQTITQATQPLATTTEIAPDEKQPLPETQLASIGPAASQSVNAVLLSKDYYDEIRRKVYQEVRYPAIALRQGRESEVAMDIKIDPKGELLTVDLSDKSRYKYFNKAAIQAVESASPFTPPPQNLVEEGVYQFRMQVNFRITPPT